MPRITILGGVLVVGEQEMQAANRPRTAININKYFFIMTNYFA
jgi:hypothetical protein